MGVSSQRVCCNTFQRGIWKTGRGGNCDSTEQAIQARSAATILSPPIDVAGTFRHLGRHNCYMTLQTKGVECRLRCHQEEGWRRGGRDRPAIVHKRSACVSRNPSDIRPAIETGKREDSCGLESWPTLVSRYPRFLLDTVERTDGQALLCRKARNTRYRGCLSRRNRTTFIGKRPLGGKLHWLRVFFFPARCEPARRNVGE